MKSILKNHSIAVTGEFGTARSHENIKRWIELNGGEWASSVKPGVTHLICSEAHWKRKVGAGRRFLSIEKVTQTYVNGEYSQGCVEAEDHKHCSV